MNGNNLLDPVERGLVGVASLTYIEFMLEELARKAKEANRAAYRRARAKMLARHAKLTPEEVYRRVLRARVGEVVALVLESNEMLEGLRFYEDALVDAAATGTGVVETRTGRATGITFRRPSPWKPS